MEKKKKRESKMMRDGGGKKKKRQKRIYVRSFFFCYSIAAIDVANPFDAANPNTSRNFFFFCFYQL